MFWCMDRGLFLRVSSRILSLNLTRDLLLTRIFPRRIWNPKKGTCLISDTPLSLCSPGGSTPPPGISLSRPLPASRPFPISTKSGSHPPIGNTDGLFSQALGPAHLEQCSTVSVILENPGGILLLFSLSFPLRSHPLLTLLRPALQAPHLRSFYSSFKPVTIIEIRWSQARGSGGHSLW